MTGNSGRKKGGGPYMPGVAFTPTPYCYRCFAETTPERCDLLCARRVGEVAACTSRGPSAPSSPSR